VTINGVAFTRRATISAADLRGAREDLECVREFVQKQVGRRATVFTPPIVDPADLRVGFGSESRLG